MTGRESVLRGRELALGKAEQGLCSLSSTRRSALAATPRGSPSTVTAGEGVHMAVLHACGKMGKGQACQL